MASAPQTGQAAEPAPWKESYRREELLEVACPICGSHEGRDVAREFGIAIASCGRCGLVYTRTPLRDAQAHYAVAPDAMLAKYEPIFAGTRPHPRDPNYREHVAFLNELQPPGDLLDVGSHCGFFLRVARAHGWRTTGVEPSATSAALARERFGLDVREGFLEQARLPGRAYDVVTLTDVLEHVSRPAELLAEVRRVLRPGGRVFVKVPNARYVLAKHRVLRWARRATADVFDAREHLVYYSSATLSRLLQDSGFEVERLAVPSPIQAGGRLRRALRGGSVWLARRVPGGHRLPLAADIVALGRVRDE
jgi:2-polyprenyl-3-methyl-5-hydroxy-6-metoxy-1,4-benzoquinol methylase